MADARLILPSWTNVPKTLCTPPDLRCQFKQSSARQSQCRMTGSSREQFMVQSGNDADSVQVDRRTAVGAAAPVSPSDIVTLDAIALAGAIRSKRVSCAEVMTAYLDHIDE